MTQNHKQVNKLLYVTEGMGAVFVALVLAAYLGGLPSTAVLHSEAAFRMPIAFFGSVFLGLILVTTLAAVAIKPEK
ncbi:MAG: hypothetical protein NWF00_02130 [Candidatus Bathyarchaeota archaeon]|nr:hypothetical protein [Candidatus Bathyarchaeota archaeon]